MNALSGASDARGTLTQEAPPPSGALERAPLLGAAWLVAQATKLMHPDRQVRVVFSRPDKQEIFEVLLSTKEAEAAIRQLMQAYADAIDKSLNFCVYPRSP